MGTGALSVLAGISFLRSCSWHSGPPKDERNEVLFSRLNNHANVSGSLRGLNIFNKILLIQTKQVSYLSLFQKHKKARGTSRKAVTGEAAISLSPLISFTNVFTIFCGFGWTFLQTHQFERKPHLPPYVKETILRTWASSGWSLTHFKWPVLYQRASQAIFKVFSQSVKTSLQNTGKHRSPLRNFSSTKGKRLVINYITGC